MQSIDEKVWQAMEIGWTKPKEAPADWDDAKIKAANFNYRALNALFNVVTNEEFKKNPPLKLRMKHRLFSRQLLREQRLSRLTTSFEEIKIEKDESFDEFYAKLKDIVKIGRAHV